MIAIILVEGGAVICICGLVCARLFTLRKLSDVREENTNVWEFVGSPLKRLFCFHMAPKLLFEQSLSHVPLHLRNKYLHHIFSSSAPHHIFTLAWKSPSEGLLCFVGNSDTRIHWWNLLYVVCSSKYSALIWFYWENE